TPAMARLGARRWCSPSRIEIAETVNLPDHGWSTSDDPGRSTSRDHGGQLADRGWSTSRNPGWSTSRDQGTCPSLSLACARHWRKLGSYRLASIGSGSAG